jgi:5'(3')-deoxyribonucleotidase
MAVDIDDVLAANAEAFVRFSNQRWGTNLHPDDYTEHWFDMWQVDNKEGLRRAEEVHTSAMFGDYAVHDDASSRVLKRLARDYDLVVITSRRLSIKSETVAWINKYYQGIFGDIVFAGFFDRTHAGSFTMTKADICRDLHAQYLIDDQLKHCLAAAEAGVEALLFGNYRWNQADALPERVTRVANWNAIEEHFFGRS